MALAAVSLSWAPRALAEVPALAWQAAFSRSHQGSLGYTASATDGSGQTHFLTDGGFLLKYDPSGTLYARHELRQPATTPIWEAMAVDSSGNVYVAGTQWPSSADFAVAKYGSTGALLWSNGFDSGGNEMAYNLCVDASGNVFVVGVETTGGNKAQLAKFSSSGTLEWTVTVTLGTANQGYAVAADAAGNAYVTGPAGLAGFGTYGFAAKFDATGTLLFTRTFTSGGGADSPGAAVFDEANSSLLVALHNTIATPGIGVVRVGAATGDVSASAFYSSAATKRVSGLAVGPSGDIFVSGAAWSGTWDVFAVAFNSSLSSVLSGWPEIFNSGGSDAPTGPSFSPLAQSRVGVDSSGYVYLSSRVGPSYSNATCGTREDLFVRKLSSSGLANWTQYGHAASGARSLAADSSGDAYVLGVAGNDPVLLKFSGTRGELAWSRYFSTTEYCNLNAGGIAHLNGKTYACLDGTSNTTGRDRLVVARYDASGNLEDTLSVSEFAATPWPWDDLRAGPVAVDGSGNVYLAASFLSTTTFQYELRVAKLDSSGVVIWTQTRTYASADAPAAAALDAAGAFCVLEPYLVDLSGAGVQTGYGVLKFLGTTGELVWSKVFNSEVGYVRSGMSLATNGTDVFVCGTEQDVPTTGNPSRVEGRLLRMDSSGTVVWSRRYADQQAAGFSGLSVDGEGRVLVTGFRGRLAPVADVDYITLSYDSAGKPRWPSPVAFDSGGPTDGGIATAGSGYVLGGNGLDLTLLRYTEWSGGGVLGGEEIVAFPNPVSGDLLNLALRLDEGATEVRVDAYNIAFQRVFHGTSRNVARSDGRIEVNGMLQWAPGVYLVRVKATLVDGREQEFPVIKVVVKR